MPEPWDVVVLGAGAAGLFCAARAAERGRRVLLLDHGPRAGRKILISGGGRANFTHLGTTAENFLSDNVHFARSALARFHPQHFVELVERHGLGYHHKTPGQLFLDGSAAGLVEMLLALCRGARGGVELRLGAEIVAVERQTGAGSDWRVTMRRCGREELHAAPALVIATGGLSIPKLGATGLGYALARQFGLRVVEPRPALVPLLFGGEDQERFAGLSGVATEGVVSLAGAEGRGRVRKQAGFRGPVLWTHRGWSGPAVLQISSYWRPGLRLRVDLAPGREVFAGVRAWPAGRDLLAVGAALAEAGLPRRLVERLVELAPPRGFGNAALAEAEAKLHRWELEPAGTEGFGKAEVTAGGIATGELSPQTLEARTQPGLFAIGEVVDVTGQLGGYNFQWAWASAAAAADGV